MIPILKRFTKSALSSIPVGRDYFDRVQIIRNQNTKIMKELELARQSLISPKVLEVKLEMSREHIFGLEDEVRRLSTQISDLKAISLRDKRQSLHLLAQKGFAPDLIVDVGAAGATVGLYDTWPSAHYLLIEPLEKYRRSLLEICAGLLSAEVVTAAVGATSGELKLAAHPTEPHLLSSQEKAPFGWLHFSVPMVTVDKLIAEVRTRRSVQSSLIKIDVDGPEIAVLQGSGGSLAEGKDIYLLEAALLDTDRGRIGEIVNHMNARSYEIFDIIEPLFRPCDQVLWQVDLIFLPMNSSYRSERHHF